VPAANQDLQQADGRSQKITLSAFLLMSEFDFVLHNLIQDNGRRAS
jgi:hypothetical protein